MRRKINWVANSVLGLYLCLLMFSACHSDVVKLDKDQFTYLLLEMHKVDAALNVSSDLRSRGQKKNYAYYNALFDKYGITNAEFDSCMHYYSANMESFDKMYDFIIDSLNRELTIKDTILVRLRKNDSISFYYGKDTLTFSKLEHNLLITEDSLTEGEYHFSMKMKLDTISTSKNVYIESYFLTPDKDTLKVRNLRVLQDTMERNYQWKQYIDSSYTTLEIYIVAQKIRSQKAKELKAKKDYVEGELYDIKLLRPFLPQNTEKRLKKGLKSQAVYRKKNT